MLIKVLGDTSSGIILERTPTGEPRLELLVLKRARSVLNEIPKGVRGDSRGAQGEALSLPLMNDCLISIKRSPRALSASVPISL